MFNKLKFIIRLEDEKDRLLSIIKEINHELKTVPCSNYTCRREFKEKFLNMVALRKSLIDIEKSTAAMLAYFLFNTFKNPKKIKTNVNAFINYLFYILFRIELVKKSAHIIRFLTKKFISPNIPLENMRIKASSRQHSYIRNKLPYINSTDFELDELNKSKANLNIAVIMDKFSYDCFKYEANLILFSPDNWKEVLKEKRPDFLLVESAWRGNDYSWLGHISDLEKREDSQLPILISWCRHKGIPTVFWNKEDPPNYDRFIEAAKLFDFVFTTDSDCIEQYKKDLGHERIFCLPFAAQPRIHNPIGSYPRVRNAAFAGSWYGNKHDQRRKQMEYLLEPAFKYKLNIFDRNYSVNSKYLEFPRKYQPYITGELSYEEMVYAYKIFKIFLNVNSVTDSPSMFSRRVFEILASGTCVISSYSKGIDKLLGSDIVRMTTSFEDTEKHLNELTTNSILREKIAHLGMRRVLNSHTYKIRLNKIITSIGLALHNNVELANGISVIGTADSRENLVKLLDNFKRQDFTKKELIILLNCKKNSSFEQLVSEFQIDNIRIYDGRDSFVNKYFNSFVVEKALYDKVAIFDSACFYGKNYLSDLNLVFEYSDASIVGKAAYYVYFNNDNALYIKNKTMEHCYTASIIYSTLLMKKEIFVKKLKPINLWDMDHFLAECISNGIKIYSADKYNFCIITNVKERIQLNEYQLIEHTENYINCIEI